ncbi:MAG: alpha-2-macroglobulin family protein [Sedimentibacter sp.]
MKKRILSCILMMCLILTSCNKPADVVPDINTSPIENKEDKFELTALNSDKQGIDKSTVFQLTSQEEINDNFIKDNLQIIPSQEYKIEKISATIHNIIPLTNLENDKIYQVKIDDEEYEYSWAFQTKKKFEVTSTIPGNDSSFVPANSGIEMYFTLSNLDEMDDFFEIKPNVEGKFIYKDNTAIFIPDKLEEDVNYTVTIKKGFGLKDSEQKLEEDYTFTFNTKLQKYSEIYFDSPLTNIYENNAKIIEAYTNDQDENIEYNIKIYQYNSSAAFANNIMDYADTGKFLSDKNGVEDIEGLVNINTIKQKPNVVYKYNNPKVLFELPKELTKGYYLLEFNRDGSDEKKYHFLQINDMLIYNAFFDNQILVFVADGKDSKGIVDAAVVVNGEHLGFTDNDGMMVIDKDTSVYNDKTISMRVEAKGYTDFIYTESFYFYDYYYRSQNESYKYLRYIDTDRPVYLPTDTINAWGFARHKDDKSINQVKIELVETDTDLILDSKTVDLTNIGTYQTEFSIKNITSQGCTINVYDNDIKISTKYISIGEYTKPLYTLNGEFNKEFVYSGESINYKLNANFFDGYPVPNLEIKYGTYYNGYSGTVEYTTMDSSINLGEQGETVININTEMKSDSWRPVTINMNARNSTAEDMTTGTQDYFEIFPKHKMLEIEQNDIDYPDSIDILLHELDNTKYNSNDYSGYEDLRGLPLSESVVVDVVERYYEKVKTGEHYDYINKVNVIEYEYYPVENTVYSERLNTVDGYVNIKIPNFNPERSYRVIAHYEDGNGNIREEAYVGGYPRYYEKLYYSLEKTDNMKNYRLNDNVNMQLSYNNENVENTENDKLVLLLMREGLIDYKTTDNTSAGFTFDDNYIPNVMINSVYIKNGYMYPVEFIGSLYYDTSEKQIHFDVTTDKEEYRPGEEVVLNIKTKDENNNPCRVDVNISVVDEAYFAVFEKSVDTLNYLYQSTWDNGLKAAYLSNIDLSMGESGGAERGGGGENYINFRDDFKDTNVFKTVTTDKNGNASFKFKLADNLTSWRITYQGISDEQYAGSGTKNITVSLPFYVDLIMGKEYLKEDKVSASLRVFGTEAKTSEQVNYEVKVKNIETGKELKYSQDGVIGDYTNISFDKLDVAQYEVSVYASYKDFEDGIKEIFNVVDSSIYFNNTDYYKLSDSTVLEEVYSNPIITLLNESSSDFYNSLNNIASSSGKRIDQTVCSLVATKYINEYFKTDLPIDEDLLLQEINRYEVAGGLSLLTYSEADVELTAKLMNIVEDEYLNTKIKRYFKRVLDDNAEYSSGIAAAMWGLSKYKEPVLLTIYDLLENDQLETRDKIYLSLALAELGDNKTAKKYYKEFASDLKEAGDYLYFESNADENINYTEDYELTALLSILGVKIRDFDTSDKLFKYIYHNPSKYTLANFEQLIYIMNRDIMNLEEIKDLFGEVTVTAGGTKKTYKLKLFDRESFSVTKDKIKDVKFSNIKGSIACKVEALGNKDDLEKNKTDDFSLGITYTLKDSAQAQAEYSHSDVVKVTIMPSFSGKVERGNYEITYIVPAGFRFIEIDRQNPFWVEEDGQKLKFHFYYDKQNFAAIPIIFYIQAAQTGQYTVDYVVIKENLEAKLNYLNKQTLTVN